MNRLLRSFVFGILVSSLSVVVWFGGSVVSNQPQDENKGSVYVRNRAT